MAYYLPDSCTIKDAIPFVTVIDLNTDVLVLDPAPVAPGKSTRRQARIKNCKDIIALRNCLNGHHQARVLDMQRCSSWMFSVIASKFDISVGLLDWAHSASTVGDSSSMDNRLQSIIRVDEKIYASRCFIGLDLLKLFSSPKKGKPFFRENEGIELFRLAAPGKGRTLSAFKRRFSCCVRLEKTLGNLVPHSTTLFISDYPSHKRFPLITYNIWDGQGTVTSLLEDVFSVFILDLEKLVKAAEWHAGVVEKNIMMDPTYSEHAAQLLQDKTTWNLLLSQTKSMLAAIDRLNYASRRYAQPKWLPIAKSELEELEERIKLKLLEKNKDLLNLMLNTATLEEAKAMIHQGENIRRIAWLIFIFLPLSLMAAVFGMNVDVFGNNPRLKWYLIAATVLLILIIVALLGFRILGTSRRKRRAGLYTTLQDSMI